MILAAERHWPGTSTTTPSRALGDPSRGRGPSQRPVRGAQGEIDAFVETRFNALFPDTSVQVFNELGQKKAQENGAW